MAPERNRAVPAAYMILKKGDEVLLLLRKGSYFSGFYSMPSGHVEAGELPSKCVVREATEEIGVTIDPTDVRLVHTMYRTKHDETGDRIDYFYTVEKWSGEITNAEPDKCGGVGWFSSKALPANTVPHVRYALECIDRGISSSELGLNDIEKLTSPNG